MSANSFKEYDASARSLKIPPLILKKCAVRTRIWMEYSEAVANGRVSALVTIRGSLLNRYPKRIADLAIKHRLPSMNERSEYVEAGGLMPLKQPTMPTVSGAPHITST